MKRSARRVFRLFSEAIYQLQLVGQCLRRAIMFRNNESSGKKDPNYQLNLSQQVDALMEGEDFELFIQSIHHHYDAGRETEAKAALDVKPFRAGRLLHLLGKVFGARFSKDGTIKNISFLAHIYAFQIKNCLGVMNRARLCAELSIGILGDEAEYLRLLQIKLESQSELMKCLGMDHAPVRYMGNYWVRKIGHLGQMEFYFRPLESGLLPARRPIVLASSFSEVANRCLLEYWEQYFEIIIDPAEFARRKLEAKILEIDIHLFENRNEKPPGLFYKDVASIAWDDWARARRGSLFNIKATHRQQGWDRLGEVGVRAESWFAVFHAREPGFAGDPFPSPRNAAIANFVPAMKEVISRGGWVIRIGDKNMQPVEEMHGLIDYAHSDLKSDWMDIFLLAECRLFVGCPSGPTQVPHLFGVPTVYTNWIPMADYPFHENGLLIHKSHRNNTTGEKLPYSGFLTLRTDYSGINERNNISVEENTPEEIRDVVAEMLDKLSGIQSDDCTEDNLRQAKFRKIAGMLELGRPRLGRAFLQANADLLE